MVLSPRPTPRPTRKSEATHAAKAPPQEVRFHAHRAHDCRRDHRRPRFRRDSEATSLTKSLFEGATTYWNAINDTQGLTAVNTAASASTHCTVAAQSTTNTINEQKTQLDVTASGMESFAALGWSPSGPVLYQYVILGSSDACAVTATVGTAVYTFQALGDIDADSSKSTFELQVGRDSEGALYHGAGFYMVDELE